MSRAVRLVGLIAALAFAAPAAAEPIVDLGPTAGAVSAVTDSAGTLHAVWKVPAPGYVETLGYCRVPAGATTCTPRVLGGFPSLLSDPHVLVRHRDGALIIVVPGLDDNAKNVTYVLVSTDGGATWSEPAVEGVGQFDIDSVALTPDGNAVDTVEAFVQKMSWQRVPLTGPPETRIVSLTTEPNGADTGFVFSANIGYLPDGRPMLVGYSPDPHGGVRYRVLGAGADPYANASWSPWSAAPALGGIAVDAQFGPNGIWAVTPTSIAEGQQLLIWRFDGRRFVKPKSFGNLGGRLTTNVLGTRVIANSWDFAQDAGGRLHVAWARDVCGSGRHCILYRRNEPRGFWDPIVYPLPTGLDPPQHLTLAPNEGGSGWLVWRGLLSGAHGYATPLVTPPHGSRVGSLRLGRSRRVTLPTHYGCIPPGGRYVARLLVSGRRRGVSIVSVRFSIDGALPRTDRRPPYRAVYTLTFPAGTRHVVQARVSYRRGGRLRRASVGRAIVMCP